MKAIDQIIEEARELGASDIHLHDGMPVIIRRQGSLQPMAGSELLNHNDILSCSQEMLGTRADRFDLAREDVDFSYTTGKGTRQRVNVYRQNEKISSAIRLLNDHIPTIEELDLPQVLHEIANQPRGLVLVTGPTGSGKSTTLAAMIDEINRKRRCHILTLEDPVEYKYQMKNCLINQREIGVDIESFAGALRSALREDPDVIMVGEMRDQETISAAITAAETGHLVFSTLHTIGAANTVDRIIDVFPAGQQQQVRVQLANVLKAVITQELLPKADQTGRVAAMEIMLYTEAIANLIRESKLHQINSMMQTSRAIGMQTLNMSLASLVNGGVIAQDLAMSVTGDKEDFCQLMKK